MKNILLATGNESIDRALINRFKGERDTKILNNPVYFREGLSDSLDRYKPDLLVLADFLEGSSFTQTQVVQIVRRRHPEVRIIYLIKDDNNIDLKKFLFAYGIYDVLSIYPKLDFNELKKVFSEAREWKDVARFFENIDPSEAFTIDEDLFDRSDDDISFNKTYESFGVKTKKNRDNPINQFVSFWSAREQSGTTMLALNTGFFLSQNKSEQTLIIDCNLTNPNLHIQSSLDDPDGNHNLAALMEDIADHNLRNINSVKNYIMIHPDVENIHILPGYILNTPLPDEDVIKRTLETLFKFAKNVGYSTVIFDVEPGLTNPISPLILKLTDKTIFPFIERPGSIISMQRLFDTEYGPFFEHSLDFQKLYPVINQATHTNNTTRIEQLTGKILNREIYAKIPRSNEVFDHVLNGHPVLMREPKPLLLKEFTKLANCIHNIFVVPSMEVKRKNIFGFKK